MIDTENHDLGALKGNQRHLHWSSTGVRGETCPAIFRLGKRSTPTIERGCRRHLGCDSRPITGLDPGVGRTTGKPIGIVERTFGWLRWSRRLVQDYEQLPENSEAMVKIAMIRIMVRRLA